MDYQSNEILVLFLLHSLRPQLCEQGAASGHSPCQVRDWRLQILEGAAAEARNLEDSGCIFFGEGIEAWKFQCLRKTGCSKHPATFTSPFLPDLPTPCFKLCGTGFHAGHAGTARSPQVEFGMALLGLMDTSCLQHLSSYSALLFVPSTLHILFLLLLLSSLFGLLSFPWGFRSAPLSICHLPTLSAINTSGRFNLTRLAWRCSGTFIILYVSHYVTGITMCPGSANSAAAAPSAAGDTRRSPLATQDQTSLHCSDAKVPLGTFAGVRRGYTYWWLQKNMKGYRYRGT